MSKHINKHRRGQSDSTNAYLCNFGLDKNAFLSLTVKKETTKEKTDGTDKLKMQNSYMIKKTKFDLYAMKSVNL